MTTIETINFDGSAVAERLAHGVKYAELSEYEKHVLSVYNNLHSKKAGNAGKRTKKLHNNNW